MKIVYLHQYFKSVKDSGGTRSYEMARRFVAAGHDVHIVSSDTLSDSRTDGYHGRNWHLEEIDGIQVHRINLPYSNSMSFRRRFGVFLTFALRSARKARALRGDVVFATSTPLTIALPAIYSIAFRKAPMVFEVRDLWPELPIAVGALKNPVARFLARKLETIAYRASSEVVALSPGIRDGIMLTGYPESKITVIPNSSDVELFSPSRRAGNEWRAGFEWLKDRPMVLYCGTLGLINRVAYLAEVAAEMEKISPEVRFVVVGSGAEQEQIRKRAKTLGVLGNNFFMLDRVSKSEVTAIFSACTVSTSLFAPIPAMEANSANKFFDSLAAGRPVVLNYGGWQKSVLDESGAGTSIDPRSYQNAAVQLDRLLADTARLRRMGVAARDIAETKFSRNDLANELLGVLIRSVDNLTRH